MSTIDTIKQRAERLRGHSGVRAFGPNCFLIPREIRSESIKEGSAQSWTLRTMSNVEYCYVLQQALNINIDEWYSATTLEDTINSRNTADLDIWVKNKWQYCKYCLSIQPAFNLTLKGNQQLLCVGDPIACDKCLNSYSFQTKFTVRDWLEKWYVENARAVLNDSWHTREVRLGVGETDEQLETFSPIGLTGSVIRKLFDYKCAYCGADCSYTAIKRVVSQFDHAIARKKGGHDVTENIALSCKSCNSSKGAKSASEFYEYRRTKGLEIPTRLEGVAREVEARYCDAYGQLTREDVLRIKDPLLKLFPKVYVGERYKYIPAKSQRDFTEKSSEPLAPGSFVTVTKVYNRAYCEVADNKGQLYYNVISRALTII